MAQVGHQEKAAKKDAPLSPPRNKESARAMLAKGRDLMAGGKLDEAFAVAQTNETPQSTSPESSCPASEARS